MYKVDYRERPAPKRPILDTAGDMIRKTKKQKETKKGVSERKHRIPQ